MNKKLKIMTSLESVKEVLDYIQNKTGMYGPYLALGDNRFLIGTTSSVEGRDKYRPVIMHHDFYDRLSDDVKESIRKELIYHFCEFGLREIQKLNERA